MSEMLYQGHGSYRFITSGGIVVYVDPFAGKGYDMVADLVLITHEHYDHNKIELIKMKSSTQVIRSKDALKGRKYNTFKVGDINISSTPAYNMHHNVDACVGFVLSFDGLNIYCAGDTSFTAYMENTLSKESIDYAILPTDGIFNMDAAEAAHCADIIGAKHAIPVHMAPGELFSQQVTDSFLPQHGRIILHPGETLKL
jgi:L-ascorbate metabolism protein UlaG (beta-lactamase superfamily)